MLKSPGTGAPWHMFCVLETQPEVLRCLLEIEELVVVVIVLLCFGDG